MKFYIQTTLTLLFICLIAHVTCHKTPTEPNTGALTGKVLLEGESNHSGITVALYELAELDTAIVGYNQRFPNVAFPISQVTEFDHRFAEDVAETKTKADGTFKLEVLEEGTYNFVAQKQGFGWKYIYHVRIKNGTSVQVGDIKEKNNLGIVQRHLEVSNVVNNIPINSGSNTAMNRICNNPMNRLANNGQLGQLKIKNAKLKMTGKKNTPENLQGKNYPTVYHASLFTNHFSFLSLNLFPLTINLYPSTLASLTLNLAPQTLNFGLCTSNNSITLYPVTEVNGTLANDTVWHRDRHYIVTEDVIVPVGTELKAEAGAVVRFDGYYKILVKGNLQAVGEQDNMIVFTPLEKALSLRAGPVRCLLSNGVGITKEIKFGRGLKSFLYPVRNGISHGASFLTGLTSNKELPEKGDRRNLQFNGVDSTSVLQCCKIEWGNDGIVCNNASPRILNNVIRAVNDSGVVANINSSPI